MIVECINDNWNIVRGFKGQSLPNDIPRKGELYHVTNVIKIEEKEFYELFEIRKDWVWSVEKFREVDIDISTITEEIEEKILI